ncbi:unnamed protein product [Lactuca saligna]|uniref:Uncharacterized protein n=1 Tax=Lactuca saligna TaxID=75948 RepID=A0AA35VDP2_LACSI|nr:unnamed protein product [Lactuca saligna]
MINFSIVAGVLKVGVKTPSSPRSSVAAMSPDHHPSAVEAGNHETDAVIASVATEDEKPPPLLISLHVTTSPLPSGGPPWQSAMVAATVNEAAVAVSCATAVAAHHRTGGCRHWPLCRVAVCFDCGWTSFGGCLDNIRTMKP